MQKLDSAFGNKSDVREKNSCPIVRTQSTFETQTDQIKEYFFLSAVLAHDRMPAFTNERARLQLICIFKGSCLVCEPCGLSTHCKRVVDMVSIALSCSVYLKI